MGKSKEDHVRALLKEPSIAQAWQQGAWPPHRTMSDVRALMIDLGPLMREQAARAAQLIDGARVVGRGIAPQGIKVGSSTGYTREMMQPVLQAAARKAMCPTTWFARAKRRRDGPRR